MEVLYIAPYACARFRNSAYEVFLKFILQTRKDFYLPLLSDFDFFRAKQYVKITARRTKISVFGRKILVFSKLT